MKKSPEERIRNARERLKACPHDVAAERELVAAIIARRTEYDELRDLCARINSPGGDA